MRQAAHIVGLSVGDRIATDRFLHEFHLAVPVFLAPRQEILRRAKVPTWLTMDLCGTVLRVNYSAADALSDLEKGQ
jgi:hypothetical protein